MQKKQVARFFFFICLLLIPPDPALAQEPPPCQPYLPPVIHVTPQYGNPTLNNIQTIDEIQRLAAHGVAPASPLHQVPVGVTTADLRIASDYSLELRRITTLRGQTYFCAMPSRFDVALDLSETTVYITRELPLNSCSYDTVMEHEEKHVATDRDLITEFTASLPALLAQHLRDIGVQQGLSKDAVQETMRAQYEAMMHIIKAQMVAVREARQKAVDSPEEYSRISQSCDGELRRIVGNATAQ